MREWVAFWNAPNSIYVSARHRDVHYRAIADDVRAYVPSPDAAVLDYGCGEALHADRVAAACARLTLCDAAPSVRENLAQRFASAGNITVRSPEEIDAFPDGLFNLIVLMSVAQYLAPEELDGLLELFRRLLSPDGVLVVGDVIPPAVPATSDAAALLQFAWRQGFFIPAVAGLVRTVFSDYRKLRGRLGLAHYDEPAMTQRLARAGFVAARAPRNIGHNPHRMTFTARPA
jgi:cyclopropane fatty-acyl-phospholipid synthase-like methyltransferase